MNIIRYYNQNRIKIWLIIIAVVLIIFMVHTVNNITKNKVQQEEEARRQETITKSKSNEADYTNESQSIISGGSVSDKYQKDFGKLVDQFLTFCKNHEPEQAYGLLTQDCKNILYPTVEIFKNQYYAPKFSTEKLYNFQSWTASDSYIYLVKIYDNMLATGKGTGNEYIQEYVSVMRENGTYKLNVGGLVGTHIRNAETTKDNITIKVEKSEVYMDYEIANIVVKNENPYVIVLDTRNETDSTYLVNTNNIPFEAMLYENDEDDFIIEPNQEKSIKIKFSNSYQSGTGVEKYVFSDIALEGKQKNTREITVEV